MRTQKKQKNKKILSAVLSVVMLFSMLPLHAFADQPPTNTKEITAITAFEDAILSQEFTVGQADAVVDLPSTITADVTTTTWERIEVTPSETTEVTSLDAQGEIPQTEWKSTEVEETGVELNVEWNGETFSTENEKEFTYTAALVDDYTLASGVELPTVTVNVAQAEQSNSPTLVEEPTEGGGGESLPNPIGNKQIYMFGNVIPNEKNVGMSSTTSYNGILSTLPKTVNTYVYDGNVAALEVLSVTWAAKTHTTNSGDTVNINDPEFTVGDVIVFEAACNVYPYMNEGATSKPTITITLTGEDISLIRQFSHDETDLDRQDAIIPTANGGLTMPNTVSYRADGQTAADAVDRKILDLTNTNWKLIKAPSGYTISTGETAANFTSDYPKGTYIYEFVLDENVEYCVKQEYNSATEEWIPTEFSKFAFVPNATDTRLPIREVVWKGNDEDAPTYKITGFDPLSSDITTQVFAKNDTVSTLNAPSALTATATNSVTNETETIEVPISWEKLDTSVVGTDVLKVGYEINEGSSSSPSYKFVEGLDPNLKVDGYAVDLNGVTLPTITAKVKEIEFSSLATLPNKEYFVRQPLENLQSLTSSLPMSINFENEFSHPYIDAVANLEIKRVTNSAGEEHEFLVTGYGIEPHFKFFKTAGTYTVTYSVTDITAKRMMWQDVWEGYQETTVKFSVPESVTFEQTVTVTEAPYEEGEIIRFADSKYNTDVDYEYITIEKDGTMTFAPPKNIDVVVYHDSSNYPYEDIINKPITWVDDAGNTYDKSTFSTATPGTYTFTAKFDTSSPSARSMAAVTRSMAPVSSSIAPTLSSIATPAVKMPSFSITVYDLTGDTLKPKYGAGSPTDPFIYYLGLGETKALLDNSGNPVLFDCIYKADSSDKTYKDGETNINVLTNSTGKIAGVTGLSVGSDPLVIENNLTNTITTHAWVYVIDDAHTTMHPPETNDWYMPGQAALPEHMIGVDKSAAWTADGADTASITFTVDGKEVAIPRSADIIMILDASGSMVNDRHWDKAKMVLTGISDVAFGTDGANPYNNRLALALFGNDSSGSFNFVSDKSMYENKINNLITPSGGARTGYTSGLVQATAYAESRTGDEANRPLYVFFFSDGDHEPYYSGGGNYTSNYVSIDNRNIAILNGMNSVNQAITIHKNNDFLAKFNNTDHGVDVYKAGQSLDKYYKYMHQITTSAENLVITDVIDDRYEVIVEELPANMTLTTNTAGKEVVTITIGRVNVGDIITVNIPIKLKESAKPTGGATATYPTNDGAKADYENFLFEKKVIDDTNTTPAADRIGKPELSYPSTGGTTPPPSGVTHTVTYTDGVDGEEVFADQVTHGIVDGANTPNFSLGGSNIPTRTGYTFTGWSPSVADTVTESIIYTAHWSRPYTVTYTDGVDGEELFADQVHPDLHHGVETPAFVLNGSNIPTRAGYTFIDWSPDVADKVIKNVVYIAQWSKNTTGGGGTSTTYYDIEIQIEGNGTVNPNGGSDNKVRVEKGHNQNFNMTPASGWYTEDVLVDGASVGKLTAYEFENVRKDHVIKVIFKETAGPVDPTDPPTEPEVPPTTPPTEPTTPPTEPTKPETNIPQTGDSSNMMLWLMLALASGLGLLGVCKKSVFYKGKHVSTDAE